jgi:hypothetical protein
MLLTEIEGKRLGLLREFFPNATLIAVLMNPSSPNFDAQLKEVQGAARAVGQQIHILQASSEREIDAAFATAAQLRTGALLVASGGSFNGWRNQLVALAARYSVPAIYHVREFAIAGGLMSYGTSLAEGYRQGGADEDNRYRCGRGLCSQSRGGASCRSDDRYRTTNQLGREGRQSVVLTLCPTILDHHVLAFDEAGFI